MGRTGEQGVSNTLSGGTAAGGIRAGGVDAARFGAGHLLERLLSAVRPEFRHDIFIPDPDSAVFFTATCALPSCPAAIRRTRIGLCERHHAWWKQAGRPDLPGWLGLAEQRLRAEVPEVPACAVGGCNRAHRRSRLCVRHVCAWDRAGRPDWDHWCTEQPAPSPVNESGCRFPACPRWSEPTTGFCAAHRRRWIAAGRPEPHAWFDQLAHSLDPRVDLRGLEPRLRLEVQYGLQCRHDAASRLTRMIRVTTAVRLIREAGVASLLDWEDERWHAYTLRPNSVGSAYQSFILDTCAALRNLAGVDPWQQQYPRAVWDLRALDLAGSQRRLDFSRIEPGWLRELAKQWARWRLSRGNTGQSVATTLRACTLLGEHLCRTAGAGASPEHLTRIVLESWFAALAIALSNPTSRAKRINQIGVFLRDVARHDWCPQIPHSAAVYEGDMPRLPPPRPRALSEHVMRQLEDPANLARFPTDDGRLLLLILIQCGLRLGDACKLPLDCVVRDHHDAPYLAWINHKIHGRVAFFPISTELADHITVQQRAQQQRWPQGCRYLFTRYQTNLDGNKPLHASTWRRHLDAWLRAIELVDEHGAPAHVTAHQFRHTVATRLINRDVPQSVVQDLLDHMSPAMTARYARLTNATRRRHWETAMKVNAEGDPVTVAPEHPLADADWMRLSLVRAKVTLPNGYCGAPVQTDCEYANPCLDCRFFITTPEFLAQHRRQRDDSRQQIADAEQAGLARVAEKNRRTTAKLDKLITVLEHATDSEIVVGGRRENNAAG